MAFSYRTHQIQEVVKTPKQIGSGKFAFENYGTRGKRAEGDLELTGHPLVKCRLVVTAPRSDEPNTYEAALLLAGERIRGVGFSPVRRTNRYKEAIPKGWHQNVIDPNLATADPDRNRHPGLKDFTPTDLQDFVQRVAKLWHIDLDEEAVLL